MKSWVRAMWAVAFLACGTMVFPAKLFAGLERSVDVDDEVRRDGTLKAPAGSKIEGKITAINLNTKQVTITRLNGSRVTLQVLASTKIERNDVHVSLSQFKVGDRGQARLSNLTLIKIEATGA